MNKAARVALIVFMFLLAGAVFWLLIFLDSQADTVFHLQEDVYRQHRFLSLVVELPRLLFLFASTLSVGTLFGWVVGLFGD
jgi:hypothetical protein